MEAILRNVALFMPVQFKPRTLTLPVLSILLVLTAVLSIGIGAVQLYPLDVLQIFLYKLGLVQSISQPDYVASVVMNIRLPRVLLGILVGACLGVCGASLQALFRNPLADPVLVGVSGGAAIGAVGMTFFSGALIAILNNYGYLLLLPVVAFFGGAFATLIVYLLATKEQRTDMATMLLAGIAINALTSAGIGIFVFLSEDQQVRQILFWLFGSLGGAMWDTLLPSLPFLIVSTLAISYFGYSLNLYLLGEQEAKHLGINVQKLKWIIIAFVALGTGTSVALSGMIGFVGLVVPHLLRLMTGPDNRLLLPASALLGGILLLLADLIARTVVSPTELPIGLVTSLLGSPFFLYLLMRQKRNARI